MGVVYRAAREDLGREFALKIILAGPSSSAESAERFRREARAAAQLADHPGIVGCHDIGEADGHVYFAMDFVDGRSLDQLIDAGDLSPQRAAALMEQAARAVHHAHSRGVIHRDLKPANIMVTAGGDARVTDFGLAASHDAGPEATRLTQSGVVLGTPAYMPPEQARGETLGAAADVYALGATLYEALLGETPFTGDSMHALLLKVLRDDPKPLRKRDPRIPADLDTIALKCLEKDPSRRYPSAQAFAEDLALYLRGEAIQARGPSRWALLCRRVRRNRAPYAVGAVGLAAVLGVGGWFGSNWWSERTGRAAAEGGQQVARQAALAQLRKRAELALSAALDLRRLGAVDKMERYLQETESACSEATIALPRAAEPHYHRGRFYRAQMRYGAALSAQDRALQLDAGHAPARYERAVLLARLLETHNRAQGETVELNRTGARALRAASRLDPVTVIASDPQAKNLHARLAADVARLSGERTDRVTAAQRLCVRGFMLRIEARRAGAKSAFDAALTRDPDLVEALEAVGALVERTTDWPRAVEVWTAALHRDRGYLPFLRKRARARWRCVFVAGTPTARQLSLLRDVMRDYNAVLERLPQDFDALRGRAGARQLIAHLHTRDGTDPHAEFTACVEDIRAVIAVAPNRYEGHNLLAHLYVDWASFRARTGRPTSEQRALAIASFERAIERAPAQGFLWDRLARVCRDVASVKAATGEDADPDFERAVEAGREAIRLGAGHLQSWRELASTLRLWADYRWTMRGDPEPLWKEARAALDGVLEIFPRDPTTLAAKGRLISGIAARRMLRGEDVTAMHREALQYLRAAAEIAPGDIEVARKLGTALFGLAQFQNARGRDSSESLRQSEAAYARICEAAPDSSVGWKGRGIAVAERMVSANTADSAIDAIADTAAAHFEAALARKPDDIDAWTRLGAVRANQGVGLLHRRQNPIDVFNEALKAFAHALEANPRSFAVLSRRADVYAQSGAWLWLRQQDPRPTWALARQDYQLAGEVQPNNAWMWKSRGVFHREYGRYEEGCGRDGTAHFRAAVTALEAAIRHDPTLEPAVRELLHDTRKRLE
jgi:tetratricopeptide (TPR) repeat protein